jgi:hypothetical protein
LLQTIDHVTLIRSSVHDFLWFKRQVLKLVRWWPSTAQAVLQQAQDNLTFSIPAHDASLPVPTERALCCY